MYMNEDELIIEGRTEQRRLAYHWAAVRRTAIATVEDINTTLERVAAESTEPVEEFGPVLAFVVPVDEDEPGEVPVELVPVEEDDGHAAESVHAWVELPTHDAPPFDGGGLVHVRVCTPLPHVAEQAPKADQPPFTRGKTLMYSPLRCSEQSIAMDPKSVATHENPVPDCTKVGVAPLMQAVCDKDLVDPLQIDNVHGELAVLEAHETRTASVVAGACKHCDAVYPTINWLPSWQAASPQSTAE